MVHVAAVFITFVEIFLHGLNEKILFCSNNGVDGHHVVLMR